MAILVEPDDPRRCQGSMPNGQCTLEALPNLKFCKIHSSGEKKRADKEKIRNLNLAVWQSRVGELADSPHAKSLREEIGILRLMLEALLNNCVSQTELLANSNKIADLVSRIEKIVGTCHNLEKSSGQLLDKSAALQLAGAFIDIVAEFCSNPEEVNKIADAVIAKVAEIKAVPSK